MTKGEKAKELFMTGLNCAQAVAAAFSDEMGMDSDLVIKLTTGFGAGIGRMREVCGTVSGMAFVISALYDDDKSGIYKRVQECANEFRDINGSIVCRELLGLSEPGPDSPLAEMRTKEYYKKRPCAELVELSANILEKYISNNLYKN